MPIFTGKAWGWGYDRYVWLCWYTAIRRDMWPIHVVWYKGKMQFQKPFANRNCWNSTTNSVDWFCFTFYFVARWVHSSVMTGGCMFQHCWALGVCLFSPGWSSLEPQTPPRRTAPPPGFCRWDVTIRWAAQWRWEARRLPAISWSEMTSPQVSVNVACQLPTEINKRKAWKPWIIPLKNHQGSVAVFDAIPVRLVLEVSSIMFSSLVK